jgi:3'-phosphoadenosine 5'-phosphosulfate sulfotransferase (PAPS reductase)/FAD synthetase
MTNFPALDSFNRYVCGVSGGKDSTALALWLWYESGIPHEHIRLTFCDTGNEDPFTYAYLDYLRTLMPIEVITPERDFWELARHKKRFPSTKARFCTQALKIIPTREYVLALMQEGHQVLRLSGVRSAEGHNTNDRAAATAWEYNEGDAVWVHRPILDWTLDQVWDIHKRYLSLDAVCDLVTADPTMAADRKAQVIKRLRARGIPFNPLYAMGAKRVGCFPCINSAKPEIRAMATFRPERITFIGEKEIWVGESNFGISTFFPRGYIPLHLNSKEVTIKDKVYDVPTIYDVVEWSKTAWGGRQYNFDFGDDDYEILACAIGGECE